MEQPSLSPQSPPPPPPLPPAYVLTGLEDEGDGCDYLTEESLQRVALAKTVIPEKPKSLDNLSALELAVKKRAMKTVEPSLLAAARSISKRVDEIRFEKSLLLQAQVVAEAKRLEVMFEECGGHETLQQIQFPSFDVASLDKLLKQDLHVHNTIMASKKVVEEARVEDAETMLMTLHASQAHLDQLVRGNVERYQLKLRVEGQQAAKNKYCLSLLQLLFEGGFKRAEAGGSRSKIGMTIQMGKATSFLRSAIRMSKKMNNLILSSANENEKSVMEEMLRKAMSLLDDKGLLNRSSSASVVAHQTAAVTIGEVEKLPIGERLGCPGGSLF